MARLKRFGLADLTAHGIVYDERVPLPPAVLEFVDPDDPNIDLIADATECMVMIGFELSDPETLRLAVKASHNRAERYRMANGKPHPLAEKTVICEAQDRIDSKQPLVYYMRLGNRVKIGWTCDLESRKSSIQPEEVLATENGDRELEQIRHDQFARLRVTGEWFRLEKPLIDHIGQIREANP